MVDTSSIDLLSVLPVRLKRVASTNGGEYHGPCPFCGGEDRFAVWPRPRDGKNPHMWCRSCGFSGDAVTFTMRYYGLKFIEACERINIRLPELQKAAQAQRKPATPERPIATADVDDSKLCHTESWQFGAWGFVLDAQAALQTDEARAARDYLTARGIDEATQKAAWLGYNATDKHLNWGMDKAAWLPAGIVIPWLQDGEIVRINIRRMGDDVNRRYIQPAGGANALYGYGHIRPNQVVFMTEGEFDALLLKRVLAESFRRCHDAMLFTVVATGSSAGARVIRHIQQLSLARGVVFAFDADEAGDQAAAYWAQALMGIPMVRARPPVGKDITDLYKAGFDILAWLKCLTNMESAA